MNNGPFRSRPNPLLNSGPLPTIGDRDQQAKAMVMQQVGALSMSIFMQTVAHRMAHAGSPQPDFQEIARQSQAAAMDYFEGLGLAQFSKEAP